MSPGDFGLIMLTRTIFPLCALLIGLWFNGCAALLLVADPPEVTLAAVKPIGLQLFKQQLQVDLRFQNSNSFALDIQSMDFTLDLNNERVASGQSPRPIRVPRYGDAILSMKANASFLKVVKQLLSFNDLQDMTYQLQGTLEIEGLKVPFENSGKVIELNKDLTAPSES